MFSGLVVLDADNTLYDWVAHFASTFRGTLLDVREATGRSWSDLIGVARDLFLTHHSVEYPYYLDPEFTGPDPRVQRFIEFSYWSHFTRSLHSYPGVLDGIQLLRASGLRVVCYSDAAPYALWARLEACGLTDHLDGIYASAPRQISMIGGGKRPNVRILPNDLRKPSRLALRYVAQDQGFRESDCVVLGDNLVKDVWMAKKAGARGVWARYGGHAAGADADMLVHLTHWSAAEVEQFRNPEPGRVGVYPDLVADDFESFVSHLLANRPLVGVPVPKATGSKGRQMLRPKVDDESNIEVGGPLLQPELVTTRPLGSSVETPVS